MKISFVSILLVFVMIVSTSSQAWTVFEERTDESSILDSIPRFVCNFMDSTGMVTAGSEEQSAQEEEEEEEEEPDCD
jgi:hypothetical protein